MLCKTPAWPASCSSSTLPPERASWLAAIHKAAGGGQSLGERVKSQLQAGRDLGHNPNGDGLDAPERLVFSRTLATHYQRPRPKASRKRPGGRVMAASTGVASQSLLLLTFNLGCAQVAVPHLDREVLHIPHIPWQSIADMVRPQ